MPIAGYYQISNGHTALLRAAYCGWWLTPYIVLRSATYFADQAYTGSVTDKNNRYLPVISHNRQGVVTSPPQSKSNEEIVEGQSNS